MEKENEVFFVSFPSVAADLHVPHLLEAERPYEIIQTITLGKMDYDNFCADMEADRQFIEDYSELCGTGEVWKCLFVCQREKPGGILIIPTDECYVKYAAYVTG